MTMIAEHITIFDHRHSPATGTSNQVIDSFTEFLPFCKELYYYSSFKVFASTL